MGKVLVINICREKLHYPEFVKSIEEIVKNKGGDFFTKAYREVQDKDLDNCSRIIICGTSLKDNDFSLSENMKFWKWLKNFSKPILGICGGMQIIGMIFGGKLKSKTEIGFYKENFTKNFLGLQGETEVYHLHNNFIDFSRVAEFEIICSNFGVAQAIKHIEKNIFGVLFHPEVRNKEIIESFLKVK